MSFVCYLFIIMRTYHIARIELAYQQSAETEALESAEMGGLGVCRILEYLSYLTPI